MIALEIDTGHTERGTYCVTCGSLCKWPTDFAKRRSLLKPSLRVTNTDAYGFDQSDMTLLRKRFEEWKADQGIGVRGLVASQTFADGLRALIVDHGYGSTDIGLMLGISHQRVSQLANRAGIERNGPGSDMRVWDDATMRFVNVGGVRDYRKLVKAMGPQPIDYVAKRWRIAGWVLRDLHEQLGRVPGHIDLADSYGVKPGRLNSLLGIRNYYGSLTDQCRILWREAGLEYPNYTKGGRGRPDREHKPIPRRPRASRA